MDSESDSAKLAEMDDQAFLELVEDELEGTCTDEQAAWLRRPDIMPLWVMALQTYLAEAHSEIARIKAAIETAKGKATDLYKLQREMRTQRMRFFAIHKRLHSVPWDTKKNKAIDTSKGGGLPHGVAVKLPDGTTIQSQDMAEHIVSLRKKVENMQASVSAERHTRYWGKKWRHMVYVMVPALRQLLTDPVWGAEVSNLLVGVGQLPEWPEDVKVGDHEGGDNVQVAGGVDSAGPGGSDGMDSGRG